MRQVRGAILISIVVTTVAGRRRARPSLDLGSASADNPGGWSLSVPTLNGDSSACPPSTPSASSASSAPSPPVGVLAALLLVFTLLLADFFDTMGTMTAIGAEAGLNDEEGTPPHAQRILVVDSVAAIAGGAAGVSSNTSYIESASGVGEGARTGLASIVTGVLFLLATFFTPLVAAIPSEAAVPALVLVGFLMMQQVTGIDWRRPRDRHPGLPHHRADAVHLLHLASASAPASSPTS